MSAPSAHPELHDLDLADQASFRWFTSETVRFSDTDMVGHVNNVAHTALVETARISYIRHLIERIELPFDAVMFVRLEIDFRRDLYYPSTVRMGARVLAVGTSSFRIGVGVFDDGNAVTTSHNVMVHLGGDGRPAPIPEPLREVFHAEMAG